MSKHTQGPWYWNTDNDLWSKDNGEILRSSDDGKPYGMHMSIIEHHYDDDVKEANKRLIAASPELLEALLEFDDAFHNLDLDCRDSRVRMRAAVSRARAAISKAT